MKRALILTAAFFLVAAAGLVAQAFTVGYLDGTVELQGVKGWTSVNIGDKIPADASIRLSNDASIELRRGATKITLLKDGVYAMANLAKNAGGGATGGVGSAITQKLQALTTEKPKSNTVGGVRGAAQSAGSVTWVDEGDDALTTARAQLDKKQYADAQATIQQAISDSASDADTAELQYMLGVAYYGQGQAARAYKTLVKLNPAQDVDWYARYVILKAQVLVDAQNWQDAMSVLTPFIQTHPTGEATQVAYLLSSFCQKGMGDAKSARASLDAGFQLDPTSGTAALIDQQRKAQ